MNERARSLASRASFRLALAIGGIYQCIYGIREMRTQQ